MEVPPAMFHMKQLAMIYLPNTSIIERRGRRRRLLYITLVVALLLLMMVHGLASFLRCSPA